MLKNKSGFTLIELMIVIAIVCILAMIALPRFFGDVEFNSRPEPAAMAYAVSLYPGSTVIGCDCEYEPKDYDYECDVLLKDRNGRTFEVEIDCQFGNCRKD